RRQTAAVYDVDREAIVVFGGVADFGPIGPIADTWQFAAGAWCVGQGDAAGALPGLVPLAYRLRLRRVSGLGGDGEDLSTLSDTWAWDGTRWAEQHPVHVPPARGGHLLVYDEARDRTLLFGGTAAVFDAIGNYSFVDYADTWEWDGTDWQPM